MSGGAEINAGESGTGDARGAGVGGPRNAGVGGPRNAGVGGPRDAGVGSPRNAGVQVLRLDAEAAGGKRYELDEEALRRLLLHPNVCDLPVVVVSVAGAYRGGKSFILDFFLRYLNAHRSYQLSGEWLGSEDEHLKGFNWRGGGERHTTGIHLWPEPIITTLNSGEKVAVLLMDTQGTFDSESTIGQNSTIFALSTLISSVQIYNLNGNIREDDLQHLQLFTEYGRLASDAQGKAFQTLLFLVRDWMSPFDYRHGFEGGEALLNRRLQSNSMQKSELREVREHIRSCFDKIKCFLMPHPGLAVGDQSFAGCLRDLTEKFRIALLELVPLLLDPEHLTPKLINGERVRAQDLFDYFQKYVDIFNSDDVPEAHTIFKATADACLMAATRAARSLYAARMEERVRGERSVSASTLAATHAAARADAERCYAQKKKLGSQADADAQLRELIKELSASMSLYVLNNEAMVRETMSLARQAYDTAVSSVCGEHTRLCLHPCDLTKLHLEALHDALKLFVAARDVPEDEEDDEAISLAQSLEQQFQRMWAINVQNNNTAVLEARSLYLTNMKLTMEHAGVSSSKLKEQHNRAIDNAKEFFNKQRNHSTEQEDDLYVKRLLKEIETCFVDFEKANIKSNRIAMQAAEFTYNNSITSAWGPQMCCFHPRALSELHKEAVQVAVKQFLTDRVESEDDDYQAAVVTSLENRFYDLECVNEFNNEQAVEQAFLVYTMKMDKHTRPSVLSILVAPFFIKLLALLPGYHKNSKELAMSEFRSRRRGTNYIEDSYVRELNQKMETAYTYYKSPILSFLRELGINTD